MEGLIERAGPLSLMMGRRQNPGQKSRGIGLWHKYFAL